LVVDDLVIVATASQFVTYDLATGDRRWSGPAGEGYSSPHLVTIDGVAQIPLMSGAGATSFAPTNGRVALGARLERLSHRAAGRDRGRRRPDRRQHSERHAPYRGRARTRRMGRQRAVDVGRAEALLQRLRRSQGHAFGFDGRLLTCIDLKDSQRKWKGGRYGKQPARAVTRPGLAAGAVRRG
jgi:hypothetical protein